MIPGSLDLPFGAICRPSSEHLRIDAWLDRSPPSIRVARQWFASCLRTIVLTNVSGITRSRVGERGVTHLPPLSS